MNLCMASAFTKGGQSKMRTTALCLCHLNVSRKCWDRFMRRPQSRSLCGRCSQALQDALTQAQAEAASAAVGGSARVTELQATVERLQVGAPIIGLHLIFVVCG